LELPKTFRLNYPKKKTQDVACYSRQTILKWSRALQAAFERVNANGGKKCMRGVGGNTKLLTSNPWHAFTWIEAKKKDKRQFTFDELCSILNYFDEYWAGVTVAPAAAKLCLWSGARLSEFAGLTWDDLREVGGGYHFDLDCKMGLKRWVRIPKGLFLELQGLKSGKCSYLFASYNKQLRHYYERKGRELFANNVGGEFLPEAFANWFQERIPDWAEATHSPHATPHAFRKTSQQCARSGEDEEDINERVAKDLVVTPEVMLRYYVDERDRELWAASNRTYQRILASLPMDVAERYGYTPENGTEALEAEARAALAAHDWGLLAMLAGKLVEQSA
jgi:integrase